MLINGITQAERAAFFLELAGLLQKYGSKLSAAETLALAGIMVGRMIALQDQRSLSSKQALEIVGLTIELGNAEMIAELSHTKGSA